MNEFTKEELELINKCIWLADAEHGLCRVFEVHKLQIKVQSLIDNYCEHKDKCKHESDDSAYDGITYQCIKCGEYYR